MYDATPISLVEYRLRECYYSERLFSFREQVVYLRYLLVYFMYFHAHNEQNKNTLKSKRKKFKTLKE